MRARARVMLVPGTALGLALCWHAWRVVAAQAGEGAVLRVDPVAEAHILAAERAHTDGAIGHHARMALRLRPTDGRAYRLLAGIAPASGQAALFGWATTYAPRDVETRVWRVDEALGRGSATDAVRHATALLDSRTALYDRLFPVLAQWAGTHQGHSAVVAGLSRPSAWRLGFLAWWARQPDDGRGYHAALGALAQRGALTTHERAQLAALLWARDPVAAMLLLPPAATSAMSADRSFANVGQSPWGWRTVDGSGWSVDASRPGALQAWAAPDAAGPALVQPLLLPAGRFVLSARWRSPADGARAVSVSLACPGVATWTTTLDAAPAWRTVAAPVSLGRPCLGGALGVVLHAPGIGGAPSSIEIAELSLRAVRAGGAGAMPADGPARAWLRSGHLVVRRDGAPVRLDPGAFVWASDQVTTPVPVDAQIEGWGTCGTSSQPWGAPGCVELQDVPMLRVQERMPADPLPRLPSFAP